MNNQSYFLLFLVICAVVALYFRNGGLSLLKNGEVKSLCRISLKDWESIRDCKHPINIRKGQAMMDALWKVNEHLYNKVMFSAFDPFHDDRNILKFLDYLNIFVEKNK